MFEKISKYVSSKSPKELIVIALVILISAWIIKTFIFPKVKDFYRKITPPKPHDGSSSNLLPERDAYLRELVDDIYEGVYCTFCTHAGLTEAISKALALNDSELIILNKYYGQKSENTMYYDIDYEWMSGTSVDDDLLSRLVELNISTKG